jgi:hypothetical protein
MHLTPRQLGEAGETYTRALLESKGYSAALLPVNAPTYDLAVSRDGKAFLVSVKVARDKQHVRLGARNSVLGLASGNFVFAYLPPIGGSIRDFHSGAHTLLILPAEVARDDSLSIHDPYWIEKDKDPNIFSVMVKGYGSHHRAMWPRWLNYREAWHLLP